MRYARETAFGLAAAVAFGIVTAGLAVAQAALLAGAVDSVFLRRATLGDLAAPLAFLALVLTGRAVTAWGQESVSHRIAAAVKSQLRQRVLAQAVQLGPVWASEAHGGEIVTLVTRGLDALDVYFARYLPQLALAVVVPVVVVVALAMVDGVTALTVVLTVPLIPVFMVLVGRATELRRQRRWMALARLAGHFLDVVRGLPTLKVYGRSHAQLASLQQVNDEYRRETLSTLRVAFLSAFVLELIATLSVALIAVGIGLRLVAGEMSLRTGLFALILAPEAYLPLRQLGARYHASEEGLAAAQAAFRIIETPPPVGGARRDVPALREGCLRIRAVRVDHPDRQLAAPAGVSFDVRPGEVVALRGASGAGKTTLLQVILGLRPADAGDVVIEGPGGDQATVGGLEQEAWHPHVAWVPQDPFFVPGTVAENVRLIAPEASDAAIREALADVGLGAIEPSTHLGEHGLGLSSGQRRRLALARALLRDAPLLLLDEPTAGLDATSEQEVLEVVRRAARERRTAVVLVAHRPAAVAIADQVVPVESRALAA